MRRGDSFGTSLPSLWSDQRRMPMPKMWGALMRMRKCIFCEAPTKSHSVNITKRDNILYRRTAALCHRCYVEYKIENKSIRREVFNDILEAWGIADDYKIILRE